jgi:ABC-type transport system substrate-binding protein
MRIIKTPLIFSIAILLTSCKETASQKHLPPQTRNVFRYPLVTDPLSFDPATVQDNDTLDLMQQIYENLVSLTDHTGIRGRLAESWKVFNGGLEYVFILKRGVRFHHGRELTAEDVKWTFDRATNPKLVSPTAGNYLSDIEGVEERLNGLAGTVSGVRVIDKYTISIKLKKFCPYFLGKLTHPVSAILPRDRISFEAPITSIEQMVGTGPFRVKGYIPHQLVSLEAFRAYHEGSPKIEKIERPIIADPFTRLNKYKSGSLDLVPVDRRALFALEQNPKWRGQLRFYKRPTLWYLAFNQNVFKPFRDVQVRKAFALAVDRQRIVQVIFDGVYELANSIIPWCVPGHRVKADALSFDPKEAQRLLREAGYNPQRDFKNLELLVRADQADAKIMCEAVVTQIRRNLGIRIKLRTLDAASFYEKRGAGKMAFYCNSWTADYLDPHNFLSLLLTSESPENKIGYHSPSFDKLCLQADSERDPNKRLALYREAEEIALDEMPWIPMYFARDIELIKPRVKGLRPTPFGHLAHSQVSLEDE